MSKFHIISDLNLDLFDHAEEQHILEPDVEYVVLAGNISVTIKRTMLFAETLAKKYPNAKLIFNYGYQELLQIEYYKVQNSVIQRIKFFEKSPSNLFFPKGEVVGSYDFFCTEGFPYLDQQEFELSIFPKEFIIKVDGDLYIGDRLVCRRNPRYFDYSYYLDLYQKELEEITTWLGIDRGLPKILVTGLGKYNMPKYDSNLICISTGKEFLDEQVGTLRSIVIPGLSRSVFFEI